MHLSLRNIICCLLAVLPAFAAEFSVSPDNGVLRSLSLRGGNIEMFQGEFEGPVLEWTNNEGKCRTLEWKPSEDGKPHHFTATDDGVFYTLAYERHDNNLTLVIGARNSRETEFRPRALDLRLGIDTCMISFPQWNTKHFPTLLRSEPTHFWGYAMSPAGSVVGIFSPDAIPSWKLDYKEKLHRINGIRLQLLTNDPLPERMGTNVKFGTLHPGEIRTWHIVLARATDPDEIPVLAAQHCKAGFALADYYTAEAGQTVYFRLEGDPDSMTMTSPDGETHNLVVCCESYAEMPTQPGFYKIDIKKKTDEGEKISTSMLTVRRPWSWYMERSREWAVKARQKGGSHIEGWYGFFPAFKIRHFLPNPELDRKIDENFDEIFPTMYDYASMAPRKASLPKRIQNHAGAASIFAERYRITGNIKDLERAAALCDFVIATQTPDGAYRSGKTHYTSVIYIAKFLMEVMREEIKLAEKDPVWKEHYNRHYASVQKAIDELAKNLDNIQTEGEMTFEDGMISCSYAQIAEWARHFARPEDRRRYIEAAEKLVAKHRCLSQLIQPDSRMHGGSLRFWESQYDVLWGENLMSSPHGWSAWRLYGLFDLYRLTGKVDYLKQALEGMGTCSSLMHPSTGELSWAFMVDPNITANVFEPVPGSNRGKETERTLGECYIPMVSQWLTAAPATPVFGYSRKEGGSCDNDVHEIFKCLAEHALTTTWVYIDEDGLPTVWNGSVQHNHDGYIITPSEGIVSEIHVNTAKPATIRTAGGGWPAATKVEPGMVSINKETSK